MKTHDCRAIQREIDEASLDARLTPKASEHLSGCEECRRFHNDRHTLRSLMADLEPVGAPADFDFRLRARLARESPNNGFRNPLLSARPIAAMALIILVAVVALILKYQSASTIRPVSMSANGPQKENNPVGADVPAAVSADQINPLQKAVNVTEKSVPTTRHQKRRDSIHSSTNSLASVRVQKTRDSAATAADVLTPDSPGLLLLVPVDSRAFKVSIDNGRGVARTISLPPVSFGSQRLLSRDASFVPSSSKGDW